MHAHTCARRHVHTQTCTHAHYARMHTYACMLANTHTYHQGKQFMMRKQRQNYHICTIYFHIQLLHQTHNICIDDTQSDHTLVMHSVSIKSTISCNSQYEERLCGGEKEGQREGETATINRCTQLVTNLNTPHISDSV